MVNIGPMPLDGISASLSHHRKKKRSSIGTSLQSFL
jgi:hypothetical protein